MTFKEILDVTGFSHMEVASYLCFSKQYIAQLSRHEYNTSDRARIRALKRLVPLLERRRANIDAAIEFIKSQALT